MADLKSLSLRIKSVHSTKKITKVMKLIAASKLRAAQKKMMNARAFLAQLENLLQFQVLPNSEASHIEVEYLFIIVSANRGLCGAYNSAVTKLARKSIENVIEANSNFKLLFIGNKSYDLLKKDFKKNTIQVIKNDQVNFKSAKTIIDNLITKYKFKTCQVFYTNFKDALSFNPTMLQLLPLSNVSVSDEYYKYEPGKEIIGQYVKKQYLYATLYQVITESIASEHMSRMLAMDNATRNSEQVIDKLTLQYNKLRQNKITTELTEIISGTEAS